MARSSDDIELMQRIAQREQLALTDLYQRYGSVIYSLALRVLQNTDLAEEITQDTILEVWHHPQKWDSTKGRLLSWLLTVTRYKSIDRLRKEKRQIDANSVDLDEAHQVADGAWQADDPLWQDGQLLRSLMKQLPTDQAQAIELAFFQGLTHAQVAEKLKLPLGTVKTRVRLGLQKLRSLWLAAQE